MATSTKTSRKHKQSVPPSTVGINVQVPERVHRALKVKAAQQGLTVADAVIVAVKEWGASR